MYRSPWLIALIVTFLCAFLVWGFRVHTRRTLLHHLREDASRLDPNAEETRQLFEMIESGELHDVGIDVPSGMMWRITLADLLGAFWYLLLPLAAARTYLAARWWQR